MCLFFLQSLLLLEQSVLIQMSPPHQEPVSVFDVNAVCMLIVCVCVSVFVQSRVQTTA